MVETDLPARLDALPFGRFHLLVIIALGITWILDGLEVTLTGALSGELTQSSGLSLSSSQIGIAGSCYLCGAVLGAFVFGWLTDRLGRKKLFFITLMVYLAATAATGLSWNFCSFALFRFLTGAGIGGPLLFGILIGTGSRPSVAVGYYIGAGLMTVAAAVEARWGVAAERRSLEEVSRPLSYVD